MSQSGRTFSNNGSGGFIQTITGNAGPAIFPTAGNVNVVGVNNITTTGVAPSTLDISVTGTTQHSLLLGNASGSINNLGVATNGQLPIGSAGADPVLSTLTAGTGISIANGAGSITISATGTTVLNYTNVNSSPYTVLATDEYISVDCSGGPITLKFPNAATLGRVFIVKDRTGNAQTNNITVTTVGGAVNIDGVTSYIMNTQFSSIELMGNGSTYEIF